MLLKKALIALVGLTVPALAQSVATDPAATTTPASSETTVTTDSKEPKVASKDPPKKEKQVEGWSTQHRIACVAELGGRHFNLKELSMPIDE